jgi:importin subunit alpha-1
MLSSLLSPCILLVIQAVVESGLIPPLIALLATAEFDIKKEAAWAVSNATSGGSHEQIKYLVQVTRTT